MDPRGASKICRGRAWSLAIQVAGVVGTPAVLEALTTATYQNVKDGALLEARRQVKKEIQDQGLGGWVKNEGDSGFSIDALPQP